MFSVDYPFEFSYLYDDRGRPVPALPIQISNPKDSRKALHTDGYLDSGAERSLFDGKLCKALGFDLFGGPPLPYISAAGFSITGRVHPVVLFHPDLGKVHLEIGFSTGDISRNILGRDFFNLMHIGFQECRSTFYLAKI